jgi:hypothetical protein
MQNICLCEIFTFLEFVGTARRDEVVCLAMGRFKDNLRRIGSEMSANPILFAIRPVATGMCLPDSRRGCIFGAKPEI